MPRCSPIAWLIAGLAIGFVAGVTLSPVVDHIAVSAKRGDRLAINAEIHP